MSGDFWQTRLYEQFLDGGVFMYPIDLLGCLLLPLSLVALIVGITSKTNRALPLAVALGLAALLPGAIGAVGAKQARTETEAAVRDANPLDRETIAMGSAGIPQILEAWGFAASVLPLFLGCALLGVGLGRLERFRPY